MKDILGPALRVAEDAIKARNGGVCPEIVRELPLVPHDEGDSSESGDDEGEVPGAQLRARVHAMSAAKAFEEGGGRFRKRKADPFGVVSMASRRLVGAPGSRLQPVEGSVRTIVPLYVYLLRVLLAHSVGMQDQLPEGERSVMYRTSLWTALGLIGGTLQSCLPLVSRAVMRLPVFGGTAPSAVAVSAALLTTFMTTHAFVVPFTLACLSDYLRRAEWVRVVGNLMAPFDVSPDVGFVPVFHRLRLDKASIANVTNWSRARRIVLSIGGSYSERIQSFFTWFAVVLVFMSVYLAVPDLFGLDDQDLPTLSVAVFDALVLSAVFWFISKFGRAANDSARSHELYVELIKESLTHSHALLDNKVAYVTNLELARTYYHNRVVGAQFRAALESLAYCSGEGAEKTSGDSAVPQGSGATAATPDIIDHAMVMDLKLHTALSNCVSAIRLWDETNPITFLGRRIDGHVFSGVIAMVGTVFTLAYRRVLSVVELPLGEEA